MQDFKSPYEFDEFFASDMEETLSPFLTKNSKKIAENLSLKSSLFALFLLIMSYVFHFIHEPVSFFCLTGVYFIAGTPALIDSLYDLKEFDVNIDVLMTLAALLSALIGNPLEGGLLLVLFALSGAIEENVTYKTKSALNQLNKLSPTLAYVKAPSGHFVQKAIKTVEKDEIILIKAGEIIPLDGIVIDGVSSVNLVHITGESIPVTKKIADEVQAGSKNLDGVLTVKVNKTYQESTLSKIIHLITQAQEAKPQVQKILDRFGGHYAQTIIFLSFIFSLALPQIFDIAYFGKEGSIYRSLSFLIAASPCALIIATPTAYLSAISACARKGILLKGGVILDAFAECKKIAFDKTGTLTTGQLVLEKIESLTASSFNEDTLIQVAATIEQTAKHPIGEVLNVKAHEKNLSYLPLESAVAIPGMGIRGMVEIQNKSYSVRIGRRSFIEELIPIKSFIPKEGKMIAYLSIGEEVFAFYFDDQVKVGIEKTIDNLRKEQNLDILMLTGDHEVSAKNVGKALNIDQIYFELKPDDKLNLISELSSSSKVAMVGDGINDAPSLARAHVGISMGGVGSKTAIDASDIVFLKDDIGLIPWLYKKSCQTQRIVKENLTLALTVITLASMLALAGIIPLWLAVILHEGGTIVVGLNSLRLLKK
jgi:heavy metal translocating P-type ATPase